MEEKLFRRVWLEFFTATASALAMERWLALANSSSALSVVTTPTSASDWAATTSVRLRTIESDEWDLRACVLDRLCAVQTDRTLSHFTGDERVVLGTGVEVRKRGA